jgi:ribosomal protein L11 methyltransferase
VKLGAGEAFGIDTDDWAYNNARENVELNGVQDRITIRRGSVTDLAGDSFDLILANIQRDVIERLLGKMIDRLRPSGLLIFSGLLADESRPVLDMLEASHLTVLRKIQEGDWIALAARRTRGPSGQINPAP